MGGTALRTLLYALVAAVSPIAFASTVVVLKSERARLNGFIFAAAFLLGEALVVVVVLTIGAAGASEDGRSTFAAALELLLGALLLLAAWRSRHGFAPRKSRTRAWTQGMVDRLARLKPPIAFWVGLVFGIGGPKRLTITIIAGTTISAAALSRQDDVLLGALYVVVAAALVWVPVALYLVAGRRARGWLDAAQSWLTAHQRRLTTALLLVFGVLLTASGLVALL